ncbi:MAG: U32 family peptidase [Planctomycetes bacterium]|nr:U32 family peptidase [Planctomycetota bacterium]
MKEGLVNLPLLPRSEPVAAPAWHEWSPATALEAPEPVLPQGEYGAADPSALVPEIALDLGNATRPVELLAPAGGPEAAFAAFHYGADAIYLGLKKFSARAEAENFTLDELAEVTAFAHSLQPRRRVFVTINTLIRQDEVAELIEAVAAAADIGVDALIIQDLSVYHLVRKHFPQLELHASTQLAVHNRAGAEALRQLGFARVVLARELTFEEVDDITRTAGVETEVFIHGALCYSYSGLCLYSSQTLGRSGNRGKCAYSCRDSHDVVGAPATLRDGSPVKRDPSRGFPFSMKDLALADFLPSLRSAGVSCFKIEGRKKSPLYVATTTDYYRRLLDGTLDAAERTEREAELQSVFSRPWTRLFLQSHRDKEVADRDTVGHRGTPIGEVEGVRDEGTRRARLRFFTRRALERHDGLQIDLPVLGKPFGFAVDHLWLAGKSQGAPGKEVFAAPAASWVEVGLPIEHPPIPAGAVVYCSSSQEVKRKYRYQRPKAGQFRPRRGLDIRGTLTEAELVVVGRIAPRHEREAGIECRRSLPGPFGPARDAVAMDTAFRGAFDKLGDTALSLESCELHNPDGRFVPVSRINQLRRELTAGLEESLRQARGAAVAQAASLVRPMSTMQGQAPGRASEAACPTRWSIKVDRVGYVDAFETSDWDGVEEVIVDIARDHPTILHDRLEELGRTFGRERIRLALPPLTRKWEEAGIVHKIARLRSAGWTRWEAGNLSAWSFLAPLDGLSLSADWSLYVLNRLAALQLIKMGVERFALSPEDGLANMKPLLADFGPRAVVIVHQDTPLFLAESCAYANLIGGCPGKANCRFESMEMVSSHGERVTALDYHCRTIVLNQGPFSLSPHLGTLARAGARSLRADFIYRPYEPAQVRERWRLLRAGRPVPGGHAANFGRGVL